MSKEELVEMINSTINENGQRNITGKTLNLALNAIVEAMGTGSGGGSATIYCNMGNETEEQKAHNAEVFQQFKALVEAGLPLMSVLVDITELIKASMPEFNGASASPAIAIAMDLDGTMSGGAPALILQTADFGTCVVSEDGSITMQQS